jgi:hypothetical protein
MGKKSNAQVRRGSKRKSDGSAPNVQVKDGPKKK